MFKELYLRSLSLRVDWTNLLRALKKANTTVKSKSADRIYKWNLKVTLVPLRRRMVLPIASAPGFLE
ncbi:hypothetical protein PPE_06270 [Paenibacillus polymyxa E681]|nr:hypothetical protein PPE_06270 [Paenibacillus polymyxa E681]